MRRQFGPTRQTRRQRIRERARKKPPPVVYRFSLMLDCCHLYIAHGLGIGMTATL